MTRPRSFLERVVVVFLVFAAAFLCYLFGYALGAASANTRLVCVEGYKPKCRPVAMSLPVQRALLVVARCEQPGRGWKGIRWDHPGPTYPGGMGVLPEHYSRWRPKGSARLQRFAHPADQLTASWRAYKYFRGVYGVRGGSTFWVCSRIVGFGGVTYAGKVVWS